MFALLFAEFNLLDLKIELLLASVVDNRFLYTFWLWYSLLSWKQFDKFETVLEHADQSILTQSQRHVLTFALCLARASCGDNAKTCRVPTVLIVLAFFSQSPCVILFETPPQNLLEASSRLEVTNGVK